MAVEDELEALDDYGSMAGFGNVLRKENARWWNPRSLAFQLAVWFVVLNGLVFVLLFIGPALDGTAAGIQAMNATARADARMQVANGGLNMFFQLAGFAVFIGAIIFGHDTLLKEREAGTAAWLMSKPLSRKALVLAKVAAVVGGVLGIILCTQGGIAYALCSLELGSPMPVLPFVAGMGVLCLLILFYLGLAMALGAFTGSRGLTLGLPLIIGITGGFFLSIFNALGTLKELGYLVPWNLTSYASVVATSGSLDADLYWPWPVLATVVWITLFLGAAMAKFERAEL